MVRQARNRPRKCFEKQEKKAPKRQKQASSKTSLPFEKSAGASVHTLFVGFKKFGKKGGPKRKAKEKARKQRKQRKQRKTKGTKGTKGTEGTEGTEGTKETKEKTKKNKGNKGKDNHNLALFGAVRPSFCLRYFFAERP